MLEEAIMISVLVGVFILGFVQDVRLIRLGHLKIAVPFMLLHLGISIWGIITVICK